MSFVLAVVCIFLLSNVFVSRRSSFLSLSVCCSFFFLPRAVLERERERAIGISMKRKKNKKRYCGTGKEGVLLMDKGDEVHHEYSGVPEDSERTHTRKMPARGYFRASSCAMVQRES